MANPFEVKYFLELHVGGVLEASVVLPNTATVDVPREPATEVTFTLGGVKREHRADRASTINVSGTSGLQHALGSDRFGAPYYASGPERVLELREFLIEYERRCAAAEDRSEELSGFFDAGAAVAATLAPSVLAPAREIEKPRLVFRALWERLNVYVEVVQANFPRNLQSARHTFDWSLQLRGYGKAEPRPRSFLGSLRDWARSAARVIDTANAYIAQANEFLDEVDATLSALLEPVRAVRRTAVLLQGTAERVGAVVEWPRDVVEELFHTADAAATATLELWASLPATDRAATRRTLNALRGSIANARLAALEFLGARFLRVGAASATPLIVAGAGASVGTTRQGLLAEHEVSVGETLQSIATRFYGSSELWPELAAINGISGSGLLPTGQPFGPGVTILIPLLSSDAAVTFGADQYGTDLYRGEDGDFAAFGDAPTNLRLVTGPANLLRALRNRLGVFQRQYAAYPAVGLPRVIGEGGDEGTAALLSSHVADQLARDPRISQVRDVSSLDEGTVFRVSARAVAKDGQSVTLTTDVSAS